MKEVYQFYLTWLEHDASRVGLMTLGELALPAILMITVMLAWLSVFQVRLLRNYLPFIAIALALPVWVSFQGCASGGDNSAPTNQSVSSAPPPQAGDLTNYFNGSAPLSPIKKPRVHLFKNRAKDNVNGSTVPDCTQYMTLVGGNGDCQFLDRWKYSEDESPSSIDALGDVWSALKACEGGACANPSGNKFLVLDLKLDYWNNDSVPTINVEHSQPFPVFAYLIYTPSGANATPKVYVLNPQYLNYEITSESPLSTSAVSKYLAKDLPGWFEGSFLKYEDNTVGSKGAFISLTQKQGDIDLGTKIPKTRVVVWPESYNAMMPEFKMMKILTDNRQRLLRGAMDHGPVNVGTGELSLSQLDLDYPSLDSGFSMDIERTYRSFNARISEFGRNWDATFLARRAYFTFSTPLGTTGTYEFRYSGEGRLLYIPKPGDNPPGPFFAADDPKNPDIRQSHLLLGALDTSGGGLPGSESESFDLQGRLVSRKDPVTRNSQFYFHDGNLSLVMDQLAAMSGAANLRTVLTNFKSAEKKFLAGNISDAMSDAGKNITATGNFIYFVRSPSGLILAAFDKTGNMNRYTYSQDRLISVDRKVRQHNPEGTKIAPTDSDFFPLYSYDYAAFNGVVTDPTWTGLLSSLSTFERAKAMQVGYESHKSLFGEAPVVSSLSLGSMNYSYKFTFDFSSDDSENIAEVGDSLGRKYFYTSDWRGFVKESRGPTETVSCTSKDSCPVLMQRLLDPRLLQVVNQIDRGVETYFEYNGSGFLTKSVSCADRNQGSQSIVAGALGSIDDDGKPIDLACETNLSRETTYVDYSVFARPYYLDPSGSVIQTDATLPAATLPDENGNPQNVSLQIKMDINGCDGGIGSVSKIGSNGNENSTVKNGAYCKHDYEGEINIRGQIAQWQDGSIKSTLGWRDPFGGGAQPLVPTPANNMKLAFTNTNQTGFHISWPVAGATEISANEPGSTSTSIHTISAEMKRLFDPYGNIIYAEHPFGAKYYYLYDYRGPSARATLVQEEGGHILPAPNFATSQSLGLEGFASSSRITDLAEAIRVGDGGTWSTLQNDFAEMTGLRRAGYPSLEQVQSHFTLDRTLGLEDLRVIREVLPDGTIVTYAYQSTKGLLLSKTFSRRKDSGTTAVSAQPSLSGSVITTTETYDYDDYERIKSVTHEDQTVTRYTYRTSGDCGLASTQEDDIYLNGGSTTTTTTQYDSAGRPTEIKLARVISNDIDGDVGSSAPTSETTTISYSPFGEMIQRITVAGTETTTESIERDINSGIVLSETKQTSGQLSDNTPNTTTYSGFNAFRQPTIVRDERRGVETHSIGVPDKDLTTEVWGPTQYEGGDIKVYSRLRKQWDGCGNVIYEASDPQPDQSVAPISVKRKVPYGDSGCLVASQTDASNFTTQFAYDRAGRLVLSDNLANDAPIANSNTANFQTQILFCNRDAIGRCSSAGLVRSLSILAGLAPSQFQAGDPNKTAPLQGQSQYISPLGFSVHDVHYVNGENRFINRSAQNLFNYTESDDTGDKVEKVIGRNPLNSYTKQYKTDSNGITPKGFRAEFVDHALGAVRKIRTKSMNPITNIYEEALETHTIDALGRTTRTEMKVGSDGSPSNTKFSMASTFNQGHLTKNIVTRNFSSTSDIETQDIVTLNDDLPTNTNVSRVIDGRTFTSKIANAHDGLGRVISMSYDQKHPTDVANINLKTDLQTFRDSVGRITAEWLTMTESIPSGQTQSYSVAGGQAAVARAFNSPAFKPTYEYPEIQNATAKSFVMNYDGFKVDYWFTRGSGSRGGRLYKVKVTTPDQQSMTLNLLRAGADSLDPETPYGSNIEALSSNAVLSDSSGYWSWLLSPLGDFKINNLDTYGFRASVNTVANPGRYMIDSSLRTTTVAVDQSTRLIKSIGYEWPPITNGVMGRETIVRRNLTDAANSISKYDSCDRTRFGSPALSTDPAQFSNSRLQSLTGNNSDRITIYNDLGKIAYAKRSHFFMRGDSAKERQWDIEVRNSYDLFGLPAATEEILSFKNREGTSDVFSNLTPLRAVTSRRFNVTNPIATLASGAKALTLKEVVLDTGSGGRFSTKQESKDQSPSPSRTGTWYYIYGTRTAPLLAFHKEDAAGAACTSGTNCLWRRYDFITDAAGNVTEFYKLSQASATSLRKPPTQRMIYGPYLNYILADYKSTVNEPNADALPLDNYANGGVNNPSLTYTHGAEPMMVPARSPFAGAGQRQDMLGFLHTEAGAYDPYLGKVMRPGPETSICDASSSVIQTAQVQMANQSLQKAGTVTKDAFSPSWEAEYDVWSYLKSKEDSAPWYYRAYFGFSNELSQWGAKQILAERGNQWYFDKSLDNPTLDYISTGSTIGLAVLTGGMAGWSSVAAEAGLATRAAGAAIGAGIEVANNYSPIPIPIDGGGFVQLTVNRLPHQISKGVKYIVRGNEDLTYIRKLRTYENITEYGVTVGDRSFVIEQKLNQLGSPGDNVFYGLLKILGNRRPGLENYGVASFHLNQGVLEIGMIEHLLGAENRGSGAAMKALLLSEHLGVGESTAYSLMARDNLTPLKKLFLNGQVPTDVELASRVPALKFRGFEVNMKTSADFGYFEVALKKTADAHAPLRWGNRQEYLDNLFKKQARDEIWAKEQELFDELLRQTFPDIH